MYKLKNVKGSLPNSLKILFKDYNSARSALRKFMRKKASLKSGEHLPMYLIRSFGYYIVRQA